MKEKAKVYCCTNQKGGAGKTTINLNLGCVLAVKHNKKVLLVDMDGQANMTTALGFNPDEFGETEKSVYNLMLQKNPKTEDFTVNTEVPNVDLIPSSQETYSLDQELMSEKRREYRLSQVLDQVKNKYDYIFVDTPPNLGMSTFNSFVASNKIIIIYDATEFALDGLSQLINTVYEIQEDQYLNINKTEIIGAVSNFFDRRVKTLNRKIDEEIGKIDEIKHCFPKISNLTEVKKSQFAHKPMIIHSPSHEVTRQFENFAKEVIEWQEK